MKNKLKFLIMDVDGTLTDGKIYMSVTGELFKSFDIKDGCGIKDILPKFFIEPIVITARESKIVANRCNELGIVHVYQGIRNKLEKINQILEEKNKSDDFFYTYENLAYIGDDILDLQCMIPIKENGGIVGCPADAVDEVKAVACFISDKNGGNGAVRDFIEYIVKDDENANN